MVVGALLYLLFIASLALGQRAPIMAASAALGVGASLLWVAATHYLVSCCDQENRGLYAGLFWGGMQMSTICGPLASYLILSLADDTATPDAQRHLDRFLYLAFAA
eukprot:COSAG01_NODE_7784_length_3059_cov_1.960135_6_plen_105_part_01